MKINKKIFLETVEQVERLTSQKANYLSGVVDSYAFKKGGIQVLLQTDFDTHLETIISVDSHDFTNGGDYMPNETDWVRWSMETIAIFESMAQEGPFLEVRYSKRGQYVGGKLIFKNKQGNIEYAGTINNLFPIFKARSVVEHTWIKG